MNMSGLEEHSISENIERVRERIERAAKKSGREAADIKIIAVTKTIDVQRIVKAIELGITDIGENRVQELCEKYDRININNIGIGFNWHMIGHLQTNKVKYIINKVHMIQSLDRVELAREIQKRAEKVNRILDVLVQVNVAREETKFGLFKEQVPEFVKILAGFKNIRVKGLMTIAPYAKDPEDVRHIFRELRKLLIDIKKENIDNIDMDYLSMGMSNDFEVAIEEGSNMVRIGTAIFGERTSI